MSKTLCSIRSLISSSKEFYERLGHLPMYIKYIYRLYEMNSRLQNKIEAGHTLMLHAKLLDVRVFSFPLCFLIIDFDLVGRGEISWRSTFEILSKFSDYENTRSIEEGIVLWYYKIIQRRRCKRRFCSIKSKKIHLGLGKSDWSL
jgi:hypothetical protein